MLKRYLEAGKIVSTQGICGEVRVFPWCDSVDFLTQFKKLYFKNGSEHKNVENIRAHKSLAVVKFSGVDDVKAAAELVGSVVFIDREDVSLPEGSFFEQDIIGLAVIDADTGELYGSLSEVLRTGANDVYAVARPGGGQALIPGVAPFIKKIDPQAGRILIKPIKGMFDDED
jgi:16S rRNA processing protein RimM